MGVCEICNREMCNSISCIKEPIILNGKLFDPIPYHTPIVGVDYILDEGEKPLPPHMKCHDCWCPDEAFHHRGCDMEECPNCGGQLISCGCLWGENEEDEGDDEEDEDEGDEGEKDVRGRGL
jgi:hypothetical protein